MIGKHVTKKWYNHSTIKYKLVREKGLVNIWSLEWKDKELYGSTSLGEGFAEAFSAYYTGVLEGETFELEKEMPLSYEYMNELTTIVNYYKFFYQ